MRIQSNNNNAPIGIFDSGLGGLTVLKKIQEKLPNENYIYYGDTINLPYGAKSDQSILQYSKQITNFLIKQNVKTIVCACNSASSVAINQLKKNINIPVFEVINPAVQEAVYHTKTNHIAIMGTDTTIKSKSYSKKINALNPKIKTIEITSPLLVPIIEEGLENTPIANEVSKLYCQKIINSKVDTLILGCTHYPIIEGLLKKILTAKIRLISSGEPVAINLYNYLNKYSLINNNHSGNTQYYVSDNIEKFQQSASKFLNHSISDVALHNFKS